MNGTPRNPVEKEICDIEMSILDSRKKIKELRENLPEEKIQDYQLKDLQGNTLNFSDLFGEHDELLLIHNMGPDCPYCTLWADGFRMMKPYFESRCAFVLETDIPPEELKSFSEKRNWDFQVVSSNGSTLKKDMGYQNDEMNLPGVSSFFKRDGEIFRHATAPFGPGDDFCPTWHFWSLLKKGINDWQPKYNL